jgi:hypothetical protein
MGLPATLRHLDHRAWPVAPVGIQAALMVRGMRIILRAMTTWARCWPRSALTPGWLACVSRLNSAVISYQHEHMKQSDGEADAIFQSDLWFDLLGRHGFEQPVATLVVDCGSVPGGAQLPLMSAQACNGIESLSNYYSGLYGPVGSCQQLVAEDWLRAVRFLRAKFAPVCWRLHPLDAQASWVTYLTNALKAGGYWTDRYFCFGNWYQPVPPGGFDAYWAARLSALRNTVARALKRLNKLGDWRLEIVTGEQPGLDAAIDAYVSVYNRSWKVPEPNPAFMPGLIRLAAAQGWLRLGLLWVGGEPVAAQVWLVSGGKANIFKLAYVQGYEKLSTGSVLTAELMRHVMDVDRVHEVDFLSGDDPYKADWMDCRRERVGLLAFDQRHWRGRLAAARHQLGKLRRAWNRRVD